MPAYDDPVDRIHDPVDTSTTDSGRRGEAALPISNLRSARRDKWSKTIYIYMVDICHEQALDRRIEDTESFIRLVIEECWYNAT